MTLQQYWHCVMYACVGLLLPAGAFATDAISVTGDTAWTLDNSPYVVNGNVNVSANAKLTIEPGVQVRFTANSALIINGTLIARGEPGKEIVFTSLGSVAVSAKIQFNTTSIDAAFDTNGAHLSGSVLDYVIVENIGDSGAVVLSAAHPFISNSIFRNNMASAINAQAINDSGATGAMLKIVSNTFQKNVSGAGGGGVYVLANPDTGSRLIVTDNIIQDNDTSGPGGGIMINGVDSVDFFRNTVARNHAGGEGGGVFINAKTAVLNMNIVRNNNGLQGGGISCNNIASATLNGNVITDNYAAAMGGGVFTLGGDYTILSNIIARNTSEVSHSGGIDLHSSNNFAITAVVTGNVVAENSSKLWPSGIGLNEGSGTISNNAIVANVATAPIRISSAGYEIRNNTIANNNPNKAGGVGSAAIYVDANTAPVVLDNSVFGNASLYDLYWNCGTFSDNPCDPPAAWVLGSNAWGAPPVEPARIAAEAGRTMTISSWATGFLTGNPVSPPTGLVATLANGNIDMQWNANPEDDVVGYNVYMRVGLDPGFQLIKSVAKTNDPVLTTSIPVQAGGDYVVTVTAYDTSYAAMNDIASTPINENQTQGNESWFGGYVKLSIVESDIAVAAELRSSVCANIPCASSDRIKKGDLVNYHITVTNKGPSSSVSPITVTSQIPEGLAAGSFMPPGCVVAGSQVTCTRSALALNAVDAFDLPMTVVEATVKDIVNIIHVSSTDDDQNPGNDSTTVTFKVNAAGTADLAVSLSDTGTATGVPQKRVYVIAVNNLGPDVASNIQVVVTLPAGVVVNPAPQDCSIVDNTLTCAVGTLAVSAQKTVEVTALLSAAGDYEFTVTATSNEQDTDSANNSAKVKTTLIFNAGGNSGGPGGKGSEGKGGGGAIGVWWLLVLILLLAMRYRYLAYRRFNQRNDSDSRME